MEREKPSSGQCESYRRQDKELVRCTQEGTRKYDHGLDSGLHCRECWEKMIYECRQRSW